MTSYICFELTQITQSWNIVSGGGGELVLVVIAYFTGMYAGKLGFLFRL